MSLTTSQRGAVKEARIDTPTLELAKKTQDCLDSGAAAGGHVSGAACAWDPDGMICFATGGGGGLGQGVGGGREKSGRSRGPGRGGCLGA